MLSELCELFLGPFRELASKVNNTNQNGVYSSSVPLNIGLVYFGERYNTRLFLSVKAIN